MADEKSGYAAQWEAAGIADDFIFGRVMELYPELCRRLVQSILPEIKATKLNILERQKDIRENREAHGIRLDVYSEDDKRVYEIEMQVKNPKNLPKRSRYYSSMIDLRLLDKGEAYDALKDVIVIFICPKDVFGREQRKYTFQNACREDAEVWLNDGATKIFLNAAGRKGRIRPEVQALFDLMRGEETTHEFGRRLQAAVAEVKRNRGIRRQYMTLKMRFAEERAEGRIEGRVEGEARGEDRLARLIALLTESGRNDEVRAAATDKELRHELYARYHI